MKGCLVCFVLDNVCLLSVLNHDYRVVLFCFSLSPITKWSCLMWFFFFARPSVGNWTTLNLAVRARPFPGNNKTYLTASGYQDCFSLSQKYTPFVKHEDIECIGKKMKSFLGVFFSQNGNTSVRERLRKQATMYVLALQWSSALGSAEFLQQGNMKR